MEVYKNYLRFDYPLYLKCKRHILKHRRMMLLEHLITSIEADCISPKQLSQHDKFFTPINEFEQQLWESCRKMAKEDVERLLKNREGGKKSAKNKQEEKKNEKAVQQKIEPVSGINFSKRESFVYATPEELLAALKRDIVPNLGAYLYMGEEPSDEQLINYLQTRISTNWEKKGGGIIRNVGSDLACWLKNPLSSKQMAKEDKSPMSDEPLSYEEMIAQKRFNG